VLKKIVAILTVFSLFIGCSPNKFKLTNKRHHTAQKQYSQHNKIYIENYILCNNLARLFRNEIVPIEEDSILNIFSEALNQLNLPTVINYNVNHCDSSFHANRRLKIKKIDDEELKKIADTNEDKIVMLPIVYIDNISMKHSYVTSSGIPGGGTYLRDSFLKIAIYLIKNNEIVYMKSARFGPVSSETATYYEEPPKKLEQEHWDRLVRLVMSDYIKRLE
jgi:hypothetical protein